MEMFKAYFDASGNKSMPAMAFCGFVGRAKKWERFDTEWDAVLTKAKVSAFHMTEFVSSKGEFRDWKGKTEERRKFITDLVRCIKRATNKGFASALFVNGYKAVNSDYTLAEALGQPYTLSGFACFGALEKWARKKGLRRDQVLIFIEQGDEDQDELLRISRKAGFKVEPLTKKDALAFEAADPVGWKYRTVLQEANKLQGPNQEEAERILRSLKPLQGIVQSGKGFDDKSLRRMCIEKKFPRRVKLET